MAKISNWSLLGYLSGITFSLFSGVRYYIFYPDLDRALVYVGLGLVICGLAWLYNRQLELGNSVTAIEDYLSEKNYNDKER